MTRIQFSDSDDPIDIRYDNVFKAVFTRDNPVSRGALSNLISAMINRDILIISIYANEPPADNILDRQIRFDINCKTIEGELVNVEMSLNPDPFEPVRLEYYAGKLFIGQDIRGTDKTYDDLRQTYQIAILAKEYFFPDETYLHTFEYYDPVHAISLNGRCRIITLELSKIDSLNEKSTEGMSAVESWAYYFQYLTDREKRQKINQILRKEEGIAMASEVLISISKDETERARLLSEYKYQVDTQSKLVHAKRQGRKEGMQQGMHKGMQQGLQKGIQQGVQQGIALGTGQTREDIARKALKEGVSVEIIQKITGLDTETLKNLSNK